MKLKKTLIALIALTAFALGGSAAQADSTAPVGTSQSCVDEARALAIDSWLCLGDALIDTATNSVVSAGSAPVLTAAPMLRVDDYNTWCESTYACSRYINAYINEMKFNAIVGQGYSIVGVFDMIIKTSLNGRQATLALTFINDAEAPLALMDLMAGCQQNGNPFGCGIHPLGPGFSSLAAWGRLNINPLKGNVLTQSGSYWYEFAGNVGVGTYFPVAIAPVSTPSFACLSSLTAPCKFY